MEVKFFFTRFVLISVYYIMKINKVIPFLALLAVVFISSCSKFEPLTEKGTDCCEPSESIEANAIMIGDETGDNGITDPDHDEEHDKDELKGDE